MEDTLKELIAVGASAAANCHPCMKYHLAKCRELEVPEDDIAAAAEVGMMVNRGAAKNTRKFVAELLGAQASLAEPAEQPSGGCAA
jgi:AhpD family alkylhydroperoxidase